MADDDRHYGDGRPALHPEDRVALHRVTEPRRWDSEQFNMVLSLLGALGNGTSIPASNSPELIQVDSWGKVIRELQNRTSKDGNEHGIALFAEYFKQDIFFSDEITTLGLPERTNMEYVYKTPQRHPQSRIIGSIHTHPDTMMGNGMSATDYEIFLFSKEQQVMSIINGDRIILTMKTSDTPGPSSLGNNLENELNSAFERHFEPKEKNASQKVFDFNKEVCAQFGLTLYEGSIRNMALKQVRLI